ncbi:MAG: hypothetical protein JJU05_12080 [Verrucomicrobia bacterium]|nr:hypothetical protein [Verrucomicrobiota bacterium]
MKLKTYYGDIHSHCGASYGHGSLREALANARMQLDFVSVTGHGLWPDMPRNQPGMERRIRYHEDGFRKLASGWEAFCEESDSANRDGEFVSFLGYEMHSCADGDQTVMYRDGQGRILDTPDVTALRESLTELNRRGVAAMCFPHHIGYKQGYRGINWRNFSSEVSPVVEIFSMHGCSEGDHSPYPYLHSMGPCDVDSTYSAGLKMGHVVGVTASTDHHSAHPGSHGHGRVAVLAASLTRHAIWEAIQNRRTVALTGDNVELLFSLNDAPTGSVIETSSESRQFNLSVKAGGAIRGIELLKNEKVLERYWPVVADGEGPRSGIVRAKVNLEVGWGSRGRPVDWRVRFGLGEGEILAAEPRFKGSETVSPDGTEEEFSYSSWKQEDGRTVSFHTRTRGNSTTVTNSNQGFSLEVEMPVHAHIEVEVNGRLTSFPLSELLSGARSSYIGGYGTPAFRLTAATADQYEVQTAGIDRAGGEPLGNGYDVYRVRVEQWNRQWAWSSPIWVAR